MAHQIGLKKLAEICRRTATAHAAGLDARTIWKREAESGSPAHRREFLRISQAIDRGATLTEALETAGGYLPPLVRDMVHIGEQTGRVDEALDRLGQYFEHMRVLRGAFLAGIAWPMFQLVVAVLLIGIVIWIMGFLPGEYDMVGLGLAGTRGALIYFGFVGLLGVAAYFFLRGLIQGRVPAAVMYWLMQLPVVGRWLQLMAMSRMAWSLGLSVGAGMNAKDCVRVALRSTQNRYFTSHFSDLATRIQRGDTLHDAFAASDIFSQDFLDAVHVGEETGKLSESMEALSKQYERQAKTAMQALAAASGLSVWLLVAAAIIFFIFRFAFFYVGLLNDVINM